MSGSPKTAPSVLAVVAHPDDIEFVVAGTMLKLGQAGWNLHYLNLTNGMYGSTVMSAAQTAKVRQKEAQAAAAVLGATWHPSFLEDLSVFYTEENIRQLCAVVRSVRPTIVLTHSLADYMEDHMMTARLTVTATFARGCTNYRSLPGRKPILDPCMIYHAMPHGQQTPMREPVFPEMIVDTTDVHEQKTAALACHASQKEWLDQTQGMESYLATMDAFSRKLGKQSRQFVHAEGWRRHLHYGFAPNAEFDPLSEALGEAVVRPSAKRPRAHRAERAGIRF